MEKIKEGIVFSNDIKKILKGNNALNYNYMDNGIFVSNNIIDYIRKDFEDSTSKIFDKVSIISEEQMEDSLLTSIKDIVGVYPHCIFR